MSSIPEYFGADTHSYMQYESDDFAFYIFSCIREHLPSDISFETAIEIGAGMGRFTMPIVNAFKNVMLVEPSKAYCDMMRKKFAGYEGVTVFEDDVDGFLGKESSFPERSAVFVFHTLHHLNEYERQKIYRLIYDNNLIGIFVEPNSFNPLILLQILVTPTMYFRDEKQYLKLTPHHMRRELAQCGLMMEGFSRCCHLPPGVVNSLLKKKIMSREKKERFPWRLFPFISAYHIMVCRRDL